MMKFTIATAQDNLSKVVKMAEESGHEVPLTRRGEVVAYVVSKQQLEALKRNPRRTYGEALQAFMEKYHGIKTGLNDEFFNSLRSEDTGSEVNL
jgi:prevent-host-death family protein